ncbi:DUF6083 domain-containing protein [Streptomyces sp. NPDC101733]|uniref:DUF6083 domain-containing protein n=1 Tax=unclassified Streptomyces TaxID=2593676 RepID=UPI0038205B91
MSTNTQERDGGQDGGPFLLAKVLADALVTTMGRQHRPAVPEQPGPTAACRSCGEAAHWHRTVRGKWILMEPGDVPVHTVPAGQRWRIAPDGTAVNLGAASPTDTCRISHFYVCAGGAGA